MVGGSLTSSACAAGNVKNDTPVKTTGASASSRRTMFPPPDIFAARKYFLLAGSCHRLMAMATSARLSLSAGVVRAIGQIVAETFGTKVYVGVPGVQVSTIASTCPSATT